MDKLKKIVIPEEKCSKVTLANKVFTAGELDDLKAAISFDGDSKGYDLDFIKTVSPLSLESQKNEDYQICLKCPLRLSYEPKNPEPHDIYCSNEEKIKGRNS